MHFDREDFVPRRGEKRRRCRASARLFNEVSGQKIPLQIGKLFFDRYSIKKPKKMSRYSLLQAYTDDSIEIKLLALYN